MKMKLIIEFFLDIRFVLLGLLINHYYKKRDFVSMDLV